MNVVVETNKNKKSVIGYVEKSSFLDFVKTRISDTNYNFLISTQVQTIVDDAKYSDGKYLVNNDDTIIYIEKKTEIQGGYFYNSKNITANIISYELIENVMPNPYSIVNTKLKEFSLDNITNQSVVYIYGLGVHEKSSIVMNILGKFEPEVINNTIVLTCNHMTECQYIKRYPQIKTELFYKPSMLNENTKAIIIEDNNYVTLKMHGETILDYCRKHEILLVVVSSRIQHLNWLRADYTFIFYDLFHKSNNLPYNCLTNALPSSYVYNNILAYFNPNKNCIVSDGNDELYYYNIV